MDSTKNKQQQQQQQKFWYIIPPMLVAGKKEKNYKNSAFFASNKVLDLPISLSQYNSCAPFARAQQF